MFQPKARKLFIVEIFFLNQPREHPLGNFQFHARTLSNFTSLWRTLFGRPSFTPQIIAHFFNRARPRQTILHSARVQLTKLTLVLQRYQFFVGIFTPNLNPQLTHLKDIKAEAVLAVNANINTVFITSLKRNVGDFHALSGLT